VRVSLSTEALARTSGRRPWVVVAAWLVLIAGAVAISGAWLQDALTTEFKFTNQPESEQGFAIMEERFRDLRKANEVVIVRSEDIVVDDGRFMELVNDVYGEIMGLGSDVVESGFNFYQIGDPSMVSDDGHSTIMSFVMAGSLSEATDNVDLLVKIVREADEREGFRVLVVGDASVANETNEIAESDLAKGEAFAIPVAMVILVLVLEVLLAAILPVILAVVSIVLALGLTALLGQAMELSFFVVNMITMMGLAVGIDYSLFIVGRYREERALGREKIDAIGIAGATASRAVFSAA
jgi:RND superfamily putative drug exporter